MTTVSFAPMPVLLDESCVTRQVTVSPGMCGGSLFFGQLGDWTWETVSAVSRTNVFDARTPDGQPAYLSFYYFHVRGNRTVHPHGFAFGDALAVTSRSFDFGSESVLTLHRLSPPDGTGPRLTEPRLLEPEEVYDRPRADSLYAENLNRWIARGSHGGNEGLVQCSPVGFKHAHLPALPERYSPRGPARLARINGTFHPGGVPGYEPVAPPFTTEYRLDIVRDLNGVGLVYFASYFSIIDTALLRLWRSLGRSDEQFMTRRVVDQRIGYYGNADPDAVFSVGVRLLGSTRARGDEIADVQLRDHRTGRLVAVAALRLLLEER